MANAGIVSENTKVQILYVKNDWKGKKKRQLSFDFTAFYIDMTIGYNHTRLECNQLRYVTSHNTKFYRDRLDRD